MKIKNKRYMRTVCAVIVMLLSVCAMMPVFSACSDGGTGGGTIQLPEFESDVELTDDGVVIKLPTDNGERYYDIYECASAYGEYELVEADYMGNTFTGNDVWAYYRIDGKKDGVVVSSNKFSYEKELFGENTIIFSPDDDADEVQSVIDRIYEQQRGATNGQFTDRRYALLFKQGDYAATVYEGYYTTVAGLGMSPMNTAIRGFHVYADLTNNNATCNFWRSVENIQINSSNVQWAVSQATSMRRVYISGNLTLHQAGGWSSGGFLSDSVIKGTVSSGSQQQWLSRNDEWGRWDGSNFNMVYVGVKGEIPDGIWPSRRVTAIESTPSVREKPFLVQDERLGYGVFIPEMRENAVGVSWDKDGSNGAFIPLSQFYVARADRDTAATLNVALECGKHILFTPGIYELDEPLNVQKEGTVIFGMGFATLRISDKNSETLMRIADADGINISGLLFDAGKHSETLLEVGEEKSSLDHSDDPICLSDLFFRVGGHSNESTYVHTSVVINSDDVIGDNFWVWRADHSHGVGWDLNVTVNGLTVNGDNVTFYGLLVEHYHEYQTLWNGENGTTYFYQSEIPYDPPEQSAYMSHNGTVNGYASYKVGDQVQNHTAYGLGIYSCPNNPDIKVDNAIEAPANAGIYIKHAVTVLLDNDPCIQSVLNGFGNRTGGNMETVNIYEGGVFR